MNSLPSSLDLFITLYEDNSYNVDLLCDRFAKYEIGGSLQMPRMVRPGGHQMVPLLYSVSQHHRHQRVKGKRGRRGTYGTLPAMDVVKRAMSRRNAQMARRRRLKRRMISPNLQRRRRRQARQKHCLGHFTRQCLTAHSQVLETPQTHSGSTPEPHTTSFLHKVICTPIRNSQSLLRYQQPTGGRSMLTVLEPCEWQRQPMVWNDKPISKTYTTHLRSMCNWCRSGS